MHILKDIVTVKDVGVKCKPRIRKIEKVIPIRAIVARYIAVVMLAKKTIE